MEIESLVERITQEVLQSLGGARPAPAASGQELAPSGRLLVVFGGDESELRCLVDTSGLQPRQSVLVLPRDSRVRRSTAEEMGFSHVAYMDEGQSPVDLVRHCDRVVVPIYRYHQLSNLAGLCDSCWDVRLVVRALAEARPVQLMLGTLETASPFQAKVDSYLREIASYGIQVGGSASAPQRAASAPGGGFPAPAPAGSTLRPEPGATSPIRSQSHAHGEGHACQLKTVGECAGLGHCTTHLPERVGIILEHGAERVSTSPGSPVDNGLARYIDHTLLKPDATREQVLALCEEARQHAFASVCINPGFVALAADALRGTNVKVCTVVGFPLGATTTVAKAMETRDAIANGADEIDMVINVGALKARNDELVKHDIAAVVEAAQGRIVKVILETGLLTDDEIVRASKISRDAGADFVKTSTGFGPGGATAHHIGLMRQTVGRFMGVKASGGIRDLATAQEMIKAGATRIGASASVKIVKGEVDKGPRGAY